MTLDNSEQRKQQEVARLITKVVSPDGIYLLGTHTHSQQVSSTFLQDQPPIDCQTSYWLLILIADSAPLGLHGWQDKIEHSCNSVSSVTTIVMLTTTFQQWIRDQRWFAIHVLKNADVIHAQHEFSYKPTTLTAPSNFNLQKIYLHGSEKAKGFLKLAQHCFEDQQLCMAAFMLHQAAEQSLRTLLKLKTGFGSHTHNISRLMRYVRFVVLTPYSCYSLLDEDKPLATCLQKAYAEARYKPDYKINKEDLERLTEKVKEIYMFLEKEGKSGSMQSVAYCMFES